MNDYENFLTMLKHAKFKFRTYEKDERDYIVICFEDEEQHFVFNATTHELFDIYS